MLCYRCLVENVGRVDAVTIKNGTAMCEKCARDIELQWQTTQREQREHDDEVLRRFIKETRAPLPGEG